MAAGIHYVGTRYEELVRLLEYWGYTVVPVPTMSRWQEAHRTSPLTGHVRLRGERGSGAEKVTFNISEYWQEGDQGEEAAMVREGASLVRYHYHGVCAAGEVRWCLFSEGRHKNAPSHLHPFPDAGSDEVPCDLISPAEALQAFEDHAYLDTYGPSDEE